MCLWCAAALASISNEAEADSDAGDDAACTSGRGSMERGVLKEGSLPHELRRRDSGPPYEREAPPSARLRRAMSDPIERVGSLSRRRSARLSDADAATAAAALAGIISSSFHISSAPCMHCCSKLWQVDRVAQ